MSEKVGPGCPGLGLVAVLAVGLFGISTYDGLVSPGQAVEAPWAQAENVFQRRADLVPNRVETVKGAAAFEKDTFTAVTGARSKVGQVNAAGIATDPEAFARFRQAQDGLSSALSRLTVVAERFPDLEATQNCRDLQAQLEGTENRIAVERMRFDETARAFNSERMRFPTVTIAGLFGSRFGEKVSFRSQAGADTAPTVKL